VTRPLAESSSFLWYYSADLGNNHLATLAVRKIHSDCHVTMRTGESMQRVKPETRMPCPHTCWDVFFNLGPRALEMLRGPRYLNPALVAYGGHLCLVCAVCDLTIWRHSHVSKPTFWRSLLTQYTYFSTSAPLILCVNALHINY